VLRRRPAPPVWASETDLRGGGRSKEQVDRIRAPSGYLLAAMSRENLELVRSGYEAWNRGDMDAMLTALHPDFEMRSAGVFPGLEPVYRGSEGWRRMWDDFAGPWESLLLTVDEMRDCDERVLTLVTFEARGRDGLEVGRSWAHVWAFRDGLVVSIENYADQAVALEAVGLRK
jgi:ketosteroid isomerase-like protein